MLLKKEKEKNPSADQCYATNVNCGNLFWEKIFLMWQM